MLVTTIAYDLERNLGRAYREHLLRLKPGDHIAFLDHDACWTTRDWYPQILQAIDRYPDAGLFGAVTNRIGNKQQIAPGFPPGHDMGAHRVFGAQLQQKYGTEAEDVTAKHLLSGVVLIFTAPIIPRLKILDGFFGVDNEVHKEVRRLGRRVYLLRGLYVQHWYRGGGEKHVNAPKAKKT